MTTKEYYQENKNNINEYSKKYYQNNKESILKRKKLDRDTNIEKYKSRATYYRNKNIDKYRERSKLYWRNGGREKANSRLWKRKAILVKMLGGKCSDCGGEFHPMAYDFHHINPEEKDYNNSRLLYYPWAKIIKEIKKCVMLCSNCHRAKHALYKKEDVYVEDDDKVLLKVKEMYYA